MDAGAKLKIRAKRKKANRKAQEKTKSWGEYVAHLINSHSNRGSARRSMFEETVQAS